MFLIHAPWIVMLKLLRCGWLTQFVNFAKYDHARSGDPKSRIVLQGVARQVLQKCGVRTWPVFAAALPN